MATTINADNGVSSGSAGLKQTADNSGSLVLQTNGTSALTIDTSQVVTFANPPTSGIQSGYLNRGLTGVNNSTTPNTQYDFSADLVVLINSNGAPIRRTNTGTITNNVSTAGPAANGRDQAGAFSANSWIHFYWIWNGTTLATVSSATAPPTGPTLPSGYTHWAYIGAVRFNGSSQLYSTTIRGSRVTYKAGSVLSGQTYIVNNGSASSYTSVSMSSLVPPNALLVQLEASSYIGSISSSGSQSVMEVDLSVDGSVTTAGVFCAQNPGGTSGVIAIGGQAIVPNVSQTVYYRHNNSNSGSNSIYISVQGYTVPNGGE